MKDELKVPLLPAAQGDADSLEKKKEKSTALINKSRLRRIVANATIAALTGSLIWQFATDVTVAGQVPGEWVVILLSLAAWAQSKLGSKTKADRDRKLHAAFLLFLQQPILPLQWTYNILVAALVFQCACVGIEMRILMGAEEAVNRKKVDDHNDAALLPPTLVPLTHWGIACDGCDTDPIIGARYKSKTTANIDLCETCIAQNYSSEERASSFVKIAKPRPLDDEMLAALRTVEAQVLHQRKMQKESIRQEAQMLAAPVDDSREGASALHVV